MTLRSAVKSLVKQVAFATPLHRTMFSVYSFMYSPSELMFLAQCLSDIESVPGCVVEAGCAYGATTVWLNKYMDDHAIDRRYYAIDTFAGFTKAHVCYEATERHKSRAVQSALRSTFTDNRKSWFDRTLAMHDITRVTSLQGDVGRFDFRQLAPIAFCLLDVDLYLPIRDALPRIYEAMSPGGMLVVDDCWADDKWDGALHAYNEFVAYRRLPHNIAHRKLGIVKR